MNGNDRASQAERAAHWLTETLEDLNRQAGSYGEMVRSLDGAKTSLLTLVGTTSQTITTLEQHISTLESLKSGEFVERVNTLAENLSGAQGIFDNALNRIVSFTGEYTNTHRALQETSQSFVEEGKKLYTEVKTLVDSLSQESEKALAKLGEKWSGDIETLDNSFRSANYNFSTLFHSFEEKLATIQSLLDQLTPMARTVADDLTANLERTMSDLNGRLTTDQENLLAIHNEDNRTLLSTFTDGIRTTGEALSVQMAETIQKTREEWEALFATRTEEIKNIFSILQNTLEGMEKNLREENEKNIQGNENLRSDLTRAVETIGQAHQTITSSL
ncbi:MAG: hypothetical protein NTX88_00850, partial [Candidatus Atribacteria bacterium]|nr:hypothetical protein [Candidatus Atribacteria bacterium]